MTDDLASLWDYAQPAVSEERFRAAIVRAEPNDALILQTQIARTWGLRKDFAKAREILAAVEPRLAGASPEAQVRWLLEMGRTWASPAHTPEQRNADAKEKARDYYTRAIELGKASRLDGLVVDALHMMVMVDESPQAQVEWNFKAIAYMDASDQPQAKAWAGSLYFNLAGALHDQGRDDEAIAYFKKSASAYEAQNRPDRAADVYRELESLRLK